MAEVETFRQNIIVKLLKKYKNVDDVWNFDETGIYY